MATASRITSLALYFFVFVTEVKVQELNIDPGCLYGQPGLFKHRFGNCFVLQLGQVFVAGIFLGGYLGLLFFDKVFFR